MSSSRISKTEWMETLNQYKKAEFGGMTVNKITLFKSTLKPTGAEYTILSEFHLK